MGAAAAAVLIRERHIVEAFARAGATSPDRAMTPDEVGVDTIGIGWRRLRSSAVVREGSPDSGRFYVDVEVWQAQRRTRLRVVAVLIAVVLLALLFVELSGPRG